MKVSLEGAELEYSELLRNDCKRVETIDKNLVEDLKFHINYNLTKAQSLEAQKSQAVKQLQEWGIEVLSHFIETDRFKSDEFKKTEKQAKKVLEATDEIDIDTYRGASDYLDRIRSENSTLKDQIKYMNRTKEEHIQKQAKARAALEIQKEQNAIKAQQYYFSAVDKTCGYSAKNSAIAMDEALSDKEAKKALEAQKYYFNISDRKCGKSASDSAKIFETSLNEKEINETVANAGNTASTTIKNDTKNIFESILSAIKGHKVATAIVIAGVVTSAMYAVKKLFKNRNTIENKQ